MPALYKFIADPHVVQFLLAGVAKFTPIPELNDPSELSPSLNFAEVEASRDRLRRDGYCEKDMGHLQRQGNLFEVLAPQFKAVSVPGTPKAATDLIHDPLYDNLPKLELLLNGVAREMSSNVGLFCLSQCYDSLPMWAHYAGNAAGLAVQFRDLEKVFPGDEPDDLGKPIVAPGKPVGVPGKPTGVLGKPIEVEYPLHRRGVTFDTESFGSSLFFDKFQDWRYEKEFRVVLRLAECDGRCVNGKNLYVYELPTSCIASVILGWNMTDENIRAVWSYVHSINPEVEILQAKFNRGKVEIEEAKQPNQV